jgi:hypothetical protein
MDEKDMNEFLNKVGSMPNMLKPLRVEIFYDAKLQEITGVASEPMLISEGATFSYLLQNVFMAHPKIIETYPPGAIGIVVNGYPPKTYSPIFDGDKVEFTAH